MPNFFIQPAHSKFFQIKIISAPHTHREKKETDVASSYPPPQVSSRSHNFLPPRRKSSHKHQIRLKNFVLRARGGLQNWRSAISWVCGGSVTSSCYGKTGNSRETLCDDVCSASFHRSKNLWSFFPRRLFFSWAFLRFLGLIGSVISRLILDYFSAQEFFVSQSRCKSLLSNSVPKNPSDREREKKVS